MHIHKKSQMKKIFLQITLLLISVTFFAQEKNEEKKDDNKNKSISCHYIIHVFFK